MLERAREFGVKKVVLTGISFEEGMVGAVYRDFESGETGEVMRKEIPGYYHGTGDVFGSALVGACESGLTLAEAVEAAVNLTVSSIIRTYDSGADIRFGVDFEPGLADYIKEVSGSRRGVTVAPVTDDDSLRIIASLANTVWREAYDGIVDTAQIAYMIERFQSFEAIRDQVDNRGYTYLLVRDGPDAAGFCGYVPDDRGLFLSKIYIHRDHRHKGLATPVFDHLRTVARSLGKSRIYLTVNRENQAAIKVYEHVGFEIVDSQDNPIGDGFVMNDYIMEMKV